MYQNVLQAGADASLGVGWSDDVREIPRGPGISDRRPPLSTRMSSGLCQIYLIVKYSVVLHLLGSYFGSRYFLWFCEIVRFHFLVSIMKAPLNQCCGSVFRSFVDPDPYLKYGSIDKKYKIKQKQKVEYLEKIHLSETRLTVFLIPLFSQF